MLRPRAFRLLLFVVPFAAAAISAGLGASSGAAAEPAAASAHAVRHASPRRLQAVALPRKPAALAARHKAKRARHELTFRWPAQGVITTRFVPSGPGHHDGIDIGSLRSPTLVAAHAGRVVHVGYTSGFEGYGNIVDVEVAPGVETLYAHLSSTKLAVGDHVREGEQVGVAGCTGICYGTHLHFEVRENGTPVDPLRFLP